MPLHIPHLANPNPSNTTRSTPCCSTRFRSSTAKSTASRLDSPSWKLCWDLPDKRQAPLFESLKQSQRIDERQPQLSRSPEWAVVMERSWRATLSHSASRNLPTDRTTSDE